MIGSPRNVAGTIAKILQALFMKSLLSQISLFFLWFGLPSTLKAQDRIWTNSEGRKITGRAVAKDDMNVQLRLADGKRVSVPFSKLSQADLDWIKDWKATDFKVKATMHDLVGDGSKFIRSFEFLSESGIRAVIYETDIPAFIKAAYEFFELEKKTSPDVTEYEKVLCESNAYETEYPDQLLIFEVREGKAIARGQKLHSKSGSRITPSDLMKLLDFLEGFSVNEWEKDQERIKKQFE